MSRLDSVVPAIRRRAVTEPGWKFGRHPGIRTLIAGDHPSECAPWWAGATYVPSLCALSSPCRVTMTARRFVGDDPDAPLDDKGARRTFIHSSRQRNMTGAAKRSMNLMRVEHAFAGSTDREHSGTPRCRRHTNRPRSGTPRARCVDSGASRARSGVPNRRSETTVETERTTSDPRHLKPLRAWAFPGSSSVDYRCQSSCHQEYFRTRQHSAPPPRVATGGVGVLGEWPAPPLCASERLCALVPGALGR